MSYRPHIGLSQLFHHDRECSGHGNLTVFAKGPIESTYNDGDMTPLINIELMHDQKFLLGLNL